MNWNSFLNRIRVSGMKTLLLTFALVVLLVLALVLRAFSSQGDADPNQLISEINRSLSRGDGTALERLMKDGEGWQESSEKGLTELEARLQALNLERTRLNVVDASTDRLRDQMDITLVLETPDLSLLGKYWQQDATDEESLLKNYTKALDELPRTEQRDVHLLVSDILGHSDSHPTLENTAEFQAYLTRLFRESLPDLRAQLSLYEARLQKDASDTDGEETAADSSVEDADIQGPQIADAKEQEKDQADADEASDKESVKLGRKSRETTTKPTAEPTTTPAPSTAPTTMPAPDAPAEAPETPVTDAPTEAPEPTPQWQAAPRIGETYTILDMNEDLVSIARQAYSDYANPEDYVYLIIEANNLPLENGQIVLYYGQTIYLPVPAQ